MASVNSAQIRAIHTLKSKARLDDDAYRGELGKLGVASSKELTHAGAIEFIDRLRVLTGDKPASREAHSNVLPGALNLSGPYAGICRAFWIDAWHLGLIEHREDTALVAFVKRQTGIDHLNWVRDAADANKVIEALKGWLAREGGVDWSKAGKGDKRSPADRVIAAQLRMLADADLPMPLLPPNPGNQEAAQIALMKRLGDLIRQRKAGGQ